MISVLLAVRASVTRSTVAINNCKTFLLIFRRGLKYCESGFLSSAISYTVVIMRCFNTLADFFNVNLAMILADPFCQAAHLVSCAVHFVSCAMFFALQSGKKTQNAWALPEFFTFRRNRVLCNLKSPYTMHSSPLCVLSDKYHRKWLQIIHKMFINRHKLCTSSQLFNSLTCA